jgi:hypothetical protein
VEDNIIHKTEEEKNKNKRAGTSINPYSFNFITSCPLPETI